MGGDDLGSDDEFLTGKVVDEEDPFDFGQKQKSVLEASTVAVVDDEETRKRKNGESEESSSSKKAKPSRQKLLLKAGRSIEKESAENQSSFLWTALVHHHQMKSGKDGDDNNDPEEGDLHPKLQAFHFIVPKATDGFASRLRECLPSMKQLKTWKHTKSPLAIIVCLSARRAVQVLKELKPLKTRTAKLFAKHLTVQEQTEWLQQTPFGLAVGTPHRLNVLCQTGALHLKATRAIILDAHPDGKGFSVCTLPDTAPHCMEFLKDRFLPALQERPKQIKLAFC